MCGGTSLKRWAWSAESATNIWNGDIFFWIYTLKVPRSVSRMPEEFKKSWVVHTPAVHGRAMPYGLQLTVFAAYLLGGF